MKMRMMKYKNTNTTTNTTMTNNNTRGVPPSKMELRFLAFSSLVAGFALLLVLGGNMSVNDVPVLIPAKNVPSSSSSSSLSSLIKDHHAIVDPPPYDDDRPTPSSVIIESTTKEEEEEESGEEDPLPLVFSPWWTDKKTIHSTTRSKTVSSTTTTIASNAALLRSRNKKDQKIMTKTTTTTQQSQEQEQRLLLLLLPIFWHIPKSGGTSMKQLAQCLHLVAVNQEGGGGGGGGGNTKKSESDKDDDDDENENENENDKVQVIQRHGHSVVNVDVSTHAGIVNARERGFGQFVAAYAGGGGVLGSSRKSGTDGFYDAGYDDDENTSAAAPSAVQQVQVLNFMVATPLLQDAVNYLLTGATPSSVENDRGDDHATSTASNTPASTITITRGALFALFRHPVERAVSLFYYLQHADWESTYRPELKNTTLLQFYQQAAAAAATTTTASNTDSAAVERNWMTYYLAVQGRQDRNNNGNGLMMTRDDLEYAKHLLDQKMLVGLTDQMDESLRRFGRYFGWSKEHSSDAYDWDSCRSRFAEHGANAFDHPKVQPGSPEWEAIAAVNAYDVELYEHALQVFEQQSVIFEKMNGEE